MDEKNYIEGRDIHVLIEWTDNRIVGMFKNLSEAREIAKTLQFWSITTLSKKIYFKK